MRTDWWLLEDEVVAVGKGEEGVGLWVGGAREMPDDGVVLQLTVVLTNVHDVMRKPQRPTFTQIWYI